MTRRAVILDRDGVMHDHRHEVNSRRRRPRLHDGGSAGRGARRGARTAAAANLLEAAQWIAKDTYTAPAAP
ncbi:hypothetical protein JI721_14860 [Alicyclobacillus cycloheptanicus]|uniref:Uncharacterized protein n=1 Tax=Alicyclobacillus cycloheptanicus TaxID=1457 RepID=A0ABT9XD41_9BACL|nr:hypothetical protein [Alicyclobacillus cycloheptanicus]MDQ0188215.1 hypothetical protein [Alicyclobacillus cycloheptanicus]WDM00945.1 hypothetical protein JI721_14860 [Alicyclobacillus cycloheptanicus]